MNNRRGCLRQRVALTGAALGTAAVVERGVQRSNIPWCRRGLRWGFQSQPTHRHRRLRLAMGRLLATLLITAGAWLGVVQAQEATVRTVAARMLPAPSTVSPVLQKWVTQGQPSAYAFPKTAEEWNQLQQPDSSVPQWYNEMQVKFGVSVKAKTIAGVHCYVVTPKLLKPSHHNRLLLGLHHGGYVFESGESSVVESMAMAGLTGYEVIHVDYRVLPQYPFPAAIDDAMAVWTELVKSNGSANIGVFGSSVGGAMVLSLVQRAQKEAKPLPGAVVSLTPLSDMSKTGDTYYTNDGLDVVLSYNEFWEAVNKRYANGHDLKDPLLSPVYGNFKGFPPTLLVSGTRDLLLSNTVRVQRELLQAGVPTELVVQEGLPHMGFLVAVLGDAPEGAELYAEIARFLDAHLAQ